MRAPFKKLIYLLLVVPVVLAGCKKTELADNSTVDTGDKNVKSTIAYFPCGTQVVANLYPEASVSASGSVVYSTSYSYGMVTVGNDATNLYVTYELSSGCYIGSTDLYVGTPEGLLALPGTPPNWTLPDGTGYFHPAYFPYIHHGYPYIPIKEDSYTHVIPLAQLPDCFIVVAIADLWSYAGGPAIRVSAKAVNYSNLKTYGYYINYCKQDCVPPGGNCETAYAFGGDPQDCFLQLPNITSNNWGWSNGPINEGTYDWPIYAGAGQCNTSNGTLVGNLHVHYYNGIAEIRYTSVPLYTTHLFVGSDRLPKKKNGQYTTAPGQFPYKHENLNGVSSDSYTITGLSGPIYIAAHSEVCW